MATETRKRLMKIAEEQVELLKQREGVLGITLYGSLAGGDITQFSDVDMIVVIQGEEPEYLTEHRVVDGLEVDIKPLNIDRIRSLPDRMQESVEDIGTDIRDISRTPQLFTPLASSLMATKWYRWFYIAAILLAILIGIMIRLLARRNANLMLVRNRQANRSARARLKKADRFRKADDQDGFYEEVGKAIWGYLADKLNIETSDLSREVLLESLEQRGISDDLRKEFLRILDDSEFSRFAPTSEKSDVNQLFSDAAALIRNLENSL